MVVEPASGLQALSLRVRHIGKRLDSLTAHHTLTVRSATFSNSRLVNDLPQEVLFLSVPFYLLFQVCQLLQMPTS